MSVLEQMCPAGQSVVRETAEMLDHSRPREQRVAATMRRGEHLESCKVCQVALFGAELNLPWWCSDL